MYATLDSGQPVMILLRNESLQPRLYDRGPSFDAPHFITLWATTMTCSTWRTRCASLDAAPPLTRAPAC
ncbi:MAG: hypothetical protein AVDCRST_MAG77-2050 [uncultured Chloroflexi bacterium]|uniref:Uncharacterized protein n=1 Tax=uncultured Chloroflexota bacterium TaxID=166587 RepID=A0A6J4IHB3_9CHLR|nr:MAG: hypothetical protein AVDCRST_MAG77-2050 [uncultured Chloroflexota bacterium]